MKLKFIILFLAITGKSVIFSQDKIKSDADVFELSRESFGFYNQLARRSWSYGNLIVEKLDDKSTKNVQIDLAASAFNYFLMLKEGIIKKDKSLEAMMREVLRKKYMTDVLLDPLNWYGEGVARRLNQPMIRWNVERNNDQYLIKVQEFQAFFKNE